MLFFHSIILSYNFKGSTTTSCVFSECLVENEQQPMPEPQPQWQLWGPDRWWLRQRRWQRRWEKRWENRRGERMEKRERNISCSSLQQLGRQRANKRQGCCAYFFVRHSFSFCLPLWPFPLLGLFFGRLLFAFSVFGYSILAMTARATLNAPLQLFVLCGLGLRNENENGEMAKWAWDGYGYGWLWWRWRAAVWKEGGARSVSWPHGHLPFILHLPSTIGLLPRIPFILMVMVTPNNAILCWAPVLLPNEGSSLSWLKEHIRTMIKEHFL